MSIFSKKDAICRALNPGMKLLLAKGQKVLISGRKIAENQEIFL
jgi:hypothetical protein